MKKILAIMAATFTGICAWWYGFTMQDVVDAVWYCSDILNAIGSAFMDYIIPPQAGIRSYVVSSYLSMRSYFGKIFGWQPLNMYDYIIDRAKANPLEAVGAVAIVMFSVWFVISMYRMLYRFYHWLLMTSRKR